MFIPAYLQISTNVNWANAKKVASTQLEVISAPVLLVINWHRMATIAKVKYTELFTCWCAPEVVKAVQIKINLIT